MATYFICIRYNYTLFFKWCILGESLTTPVKTMTRNRYFHLLHEFMDAGLYNVSHNTGLSKLRRPFPTVVDFKTKDQKWNKWTFCLEKGNRVSRGVKQIHYEHSQRSTLLKYKSINISDKVQLFFNSTYKLF